MLEVANLIAVVGGNTTAHEVRQRARRMISGLILKYLNGEEFYHTARLRNRLARLKLVLSDTASGTSQDLQKLANFRSLCKSHTETYGE